MPKQPDPEVQAVLDAMEEEGVPELNTLSVEEARAFLKELAITDEDRMDPVASTEDLSVPGPAGEIPVRIYTPHGDGPFPVLTFFHGGGWVLGDLDGNDENCRAIADETGCIVASVDYRLAPEAKFPEPLKDCYAATEYVAENASSFGGDPDRIAVGGSSSGANLAAAVSLMARDRGGPELVHQLLVYPVTDYAFDTDSYAENAEGYFLTTADMEWFWDLYLDDEIDGKHQYASPLQARTLGSLPPASIVTAGFDPLRDDGIAYADRLEEDGTPVDHHHYDGAIHGFFGMLIEPELPQARNALAAVADDLQRSFDS